MLRCAITDGSCLPGTAARWAAQGVDFVQLRAKTLPAGALATIARTILGELRSSSTRLLINGRADVAAAIGAAGVHLTARSGELTPEQVRTVFARAGLQHPIVGGSCHTLDEVARARDAGADLLLFGPVFEKRAGGAVVVPGKGLVTLHAACAAAGPVPVLALGGITADNSGPCIEAGAAGIAAIRLFA